MKLLLFILLLCAAGCAGYENYVYRQQEDLYVQQRTNVTSDMADLKKKNSDLERETASLHDKYEGLQHQTADLQAELHRVQAMTNAPAAAAPAP